MKKLIFLVVCLLAGGMPVFSQTYQELCDRAVTYTEQDSLPPSLKAGTGKSSQCPSVFQSRYDTASSKAVRAGFGVL